MDLNKIELSVTIRVLQDRINDLVDEEKPTAAYELCLIRDKLQNQLEDFKGSN